MKDIVEHVARSIFKQRNGYDADQCAVHDMAWPEGEEWRNQVWADDVPAARAAIRATLEFARDNCSDDMVLEGCLGFGPTVSSLNVEACFRAMLSALLAEIEGGAKT